MMLGSVYAGLAFSNAILGAVHAMAHSLGGLLDLPHGQCNAILLDHVMDYNFSAEPERYTDIGLALGARVGNRLLLGELALELGIVLPGLHRLELLGGGLAGVSGSGAPLIEIDQLL